MARINTNVSSLIAQTRLARSNGQLETTLQRLATGSRINRGADDPAGLIISERLRTELAGLQQGIKNSERASGVISTTEAALSEVSDLLNSIKGLVVEAANSGAVSKEEVDANQLQIDSAIDSITRIANTASFAGLKLLNGSLSYSTSGVNTAQLVKTQLFGVNFGDRSSVDVDVEVLGSAQTAKLFLNTNWAVADQLPSTVTLEVAGRTGVDEYVFASGASVNNIIDAINDRSSITGVRAVRVNAGDPTSGIAFLSTGFGSEDFVSVKRLSGGSALTFARLNNDAPGFINWGTPSSFSVADIDHGRDVTVLINGALATGRGLEVTLRNPDLDMKVLLSSTFATTVSGTSESFVITGGGARYQLGPQVTTQQQISIGLNSIAATRLGGAYVPINGGASQELQFLSSLKSGGDNNLATGNLSNASRVLESAIDEVSSLRGRLGAFERNILQTNIASLQAGFENITASESNIRDADFARETSELSRAQILVSAGTSVLATANANAQTVLQLLG